VSEREDNAVLRTVVRPLRRTRLACARRVGHLGTLSDTATALQVYPTPTWQLAIGIVEKYR